jgi:pre-rRNA-processing protein TSR4
MTNPFSSPSPSSMSNPFAKLTAQGAAPAISPATTPMLDLSQTFAQKVSLNASPTAPAPKNDNGPPLLDSDLPTPYPTFHLDADYESLDAEPAQPDQNVQVMDVDDSTGGSSSKDDADTFESTIDKTFQRFADRLAQNPEQVLRYEFKGTPLLYSKTDRVGKLFPHSHAVGEANPKVLTTSSGMPRCKNCGAQRVFELQLTPHAIVELEAEEEVLDGMEWGTVILGVCGVDCVVEREGGGRVAYLEEWVGVQWEEVKR